MEEGLYSKSFPIFTSHGLMNGKVCNLMHELYIQLFTKRTTWEVGYVLQKVTFFFEDKTLADKKGFIVVVVD